MVKGSNKKTSLSKLKEKKVSKMKITNTNFWKIEESLRFEDEDDYEYEILSILSSARA